MSETTIQPASESSGENLMIPNVEPAHSHPERAYAEVAVPATSTRESAYPPIPPATFGNELFKYTVSILILATGAGIMYGLYLLKEPPKQKTSQELVPMVGTVSAMTYTGQLDKIISGTVVPYREIKVAAEVNGTVIKKYESFEAGNFVKKGTKLIEIDPEDYQLQLQTGLAEVEQSQKMLEESMEEVVGTKRNIELAKNEYQLAIDEHKRNDNIRNSLSSSELDQSKRGLLTAESTLTTRKNSLDMLNARVKRLQASLALSKAQLGRTKLNLQKTTIVAPDDGVIVREMVQEGDYVRAGDQLVTFEDTRRSEVICNLTPTDLAWVRNNSPASSEFEKEASPESFSVYYLPKTKVAVYELGDASVVWDGMLERFDGIGRDESTRTIPCRITIENPVIETDSGPRALVRGMYVKCKIQVQTSADSDKRKFLSFPAVALRPGNVVWTVEDHKLKKHIVEVIDYGERLIDDQTVKIVVVAEKEGSLMHGEEVVTTPLAQPSDGVKVILEGELAQLAQAKVEGAESADETSDSPETEPAVAE